MVAETHGM